LVKKIKGRKKMTHFLCLSCNEIYFIENNQRKKKCPKCLKIDYKWFCLECSNFYAKTVLMSRHKNTKKHFLKDIDNNTITLFFYFDSKVYNLKLLNDYSISLLKNLLISINFKFIEINKFLKIT
jgi:hypothetical protein